jgi:hypothetical protein
MSNPTKVSDEEVWRVFNAAEDGGDDEALGKRLRDTFSWSYIMRDPLGSCAPSDEARARTASTTPSSSPTSTLRRTFRRIATRRSS